ncbi:GSCOCG00011152001-RA-CDS [Cotesia congregata]|nr:GSCOCG00011152001-RA-CDS [Cotesia congregata]
MVSRCTASPMLVFGEPFYGHNDLKSDQILLAYPFCESETINSGYSKNPESFKSAFCIIILTTLGGMSSL